MRQLISCHITMLLGCVKIDFLATLKNISFWLFWENWIVFYTSLMQCGGRSKSYSSPSLWNVKLNGFRYFSPFICEELQILWRQPQSDSPFFNFLIHFNFSTIQFIMLSSAACFKLWFYENICAAKAQNRDLKTIRGNNLLGIFLAIHSLILIQTLDERSCAHNWGYSAFLLHI